MLNQTSQYNRKTKDLLDSIETSGETATCTKRKWLYIAKLMGKSLEYRENSLARESII